MIAPRAIEAAMAPLALVAVRCVEAQHVVSTRKLVDSSAEQELLEQLIERGKPPVPDEPEFVGLHYLLATSFRYPPLPHGSRFGTRAERSLWYGAERLRTAFAEAAYYRLLFLEGTEAPLDRIEVELTTFQVRVETPRGLDLAAPAFAREAASISSPVDYGASQAAGRAMRAAGVEAFRFVSARDRAHGINVGVFTPRAFAAKRPSAPRAWHCTAWRTGADAGVDAGVEITRKDFFRRETFVFPRADFEVGGRLPAPGLGNA